jgi:hypothetical protein
MNETIQIPEKPNLWNRCKLHIHTLLLGLQPTASKTLEVKKKYLGPNVSRRSFLIKTGASLASMLVFPSSLQGASSVEQTSAKNFEGMPPNCEKILIEGRMKVFVDANTIPQYFSIADPDDPHTPAELLPVSDVDKAYFILARRDAMRESKVYCPEVIVQDPFFFQDVREFAQIAVDSAENTYVRDLPEDVVSPELATKYGVTIHNHSSSECGQIHFREAAFQPGGLLYGLVLLNTDTGNASPEKSFSKRSLEVYAVNAPLICQEGLSHEQKNALGEWGVQNLDMVVDLIRERRREILDYLQTAIMVDESMLLVLSDAVLLRETINRLVDTKTLLAQVTKLSPMEFYYRYAGSKAAAGLAICMQDPENKDQIFLACGSGNTFNSLQYLFAYEPSGYLKVVQREKVPFLAGVDQNHILLPRIDESFPTLEELDQIVRMRGAPDGYLYGATKQVGLTLRHEIIHVWLISWLKKLKERNLLEQLPWLNNLEKIVGRSPTTDKLLENEFLTDLYAAMTLKDAQDLLEKSMDDSGYSIVISVKPTQQNPEGGYMITERQNNKHSVSM